MKKYSTILLKMKDLKNKTCFSPDQTWYFILKFNDICSVETIFINI